MNTTLILLIAAYAVAAIAFTDWMLKHPVQAARVVLLGDWRTWVYWTVTTIVSLATFYWIYLMPAVALWSIAAITLINGVQVYFRRSQFLEYLNAGAYIQKYRSFYFS